MTLKENFVIKKAEMKAKQFTKRREIQRLGIKIIRFMSVSRADQIVSTSENEVVSVCRRLLSDKDSELSMTPVTLRREIKNKRLGIKVMINNMSVTINQNKTSYLILLSERKSTYLINMFNIKKEADMDIEEAEINKEIKDSIKTMYNYIIDNSIDDEKK